ncbi:stage II sporulation protein M [Enterovirga rhinocerotis]|uniref:Putative membrane protein SpoIIM required for sporulation n=1 Tax=Enterovirga rhinocerotis TaxID=1339210 RepID=A0A4R7BJU3_9HYPH|nr:stage II sporulation protein M [Enterovirga rhinocerotis]TDR85283.1 putative membrane protein SpoIIM required for sporulation [Enterovirga rhinocerotis]
MPTARPVATVTLRSAEFRRTREAAWRTLDELISRVERKGLSHLSADELQELPLLYRTAASSLSVARSIALDRNLILYLEGLVLRAFFVVYGPRTGIMEALAGFLKHGFPAAVRKAGWHILLATLALASGVAIGFMLVLPNEGWFGVLVPETLAGGRGPASTAQQLLDTEIFAPWPGIVDSFVVFANFLFRHNATIGIMTFGLGFLAGVPTLLLLGYQGIVLGAFFALHHNRGLLYDFVGWVSIHGVTEIGALILCGAGGLVIAENILFPRRHGRLDSLALAGKAAAGLAGGAVLMLFVAGLIEGGLRQLIASTPWRLVIGAATGILWTAYFLLLGRREGHGPAA